MTKQEREAKKRMDEWRSKVLPPRAGFPIKRLSDEEKAA